MSVNYLGNFACSYCEQESKLVKGGYMGDYLGDYYRGN